MAKNWNNKFKLGFSLALVLALVVTSLVLADNVKNDVGSSGIKAITAGGSTTIKYWIQDTGAQDSCEASDGTSVTITINVPSGVTASPSSLTFSACNKQSEGSPNNTQDVTFSSLTAGDYPITVSASDTGDPTGYNTSPANFTLNVTAPSDTTPPVITPNVVGTLGSNGWYVSDVTVSWTVVDNQSAISSTSGCNSTTISADTAGTTLTCSATSAGGTSSQSVTIKRDATAPSVSASASPAANANGWNNTSVTVSFSGTDSLSGIDSCDADTVLSSEGAGQSATGSCTDKAGNSASATASGINIDKTKPTISAAATTAPNAAGWYKDDVTVHFTCSDGLSGIPAGACPADQVLSTEGTGVASTAQTVTDAAGNTSDPSNVVTVNIDKTKPTISAAATTLPNAAGWYKSDVTVHFTCSDGLSGIPAGACPADQVLSTEGAAVSSTAQTVTDAAGNTSDPSNVVTVSIDKTKPTISAAATTAPNGAGWYNSDVTVSFTCSDALSGIPTGACPADQVLSTEGAAVSSTVQTVTDAAGNTSDPSNVVTVSIDKIPPTITWSGGPADGSSHYFGFVPAAPTCTAADALSGPDGCSVTGYGTTVGSHTITATAKDMAGNSKAETRSYTVLAWRLSGFYQPVDMPTQNNLVYNVVKNGSTVPLKFEIFAGTTELTDVAYVKSLTYAQTACNATAETDEIETTATGGTILRYDTTGGQFIFNWKTPSTAGKCYRVTMTTQDLSTLVAYFKLK